MLRLVTRDWIEIMSHSLYMCSLKRWYSDLFKAFYCVRISLSTIVLNSRDWSEIVWLPKILRFKINLAIGFIWKKPTGMHWLGYNDAVSWLNEAKTQIFQPTANFEIFEIYLYFVCLPPCHKTRLR